MNRMVLQSILIVAFASQASAVHWLNEGDQRAINDAAQYSLEYAKTHESTEWFNPDTGSSGTFTPVSTHEEPNGRVCREYSVNAIIAGREDQVDGIACRMPDGSWLEENSESPAYYPPPDSAYGSSNWTWVVPRISVSGGYCHNGFCIGGNYYGYSDPWRYSPFGLSFGYWGYGHGSHHRSHYSQRYRHHDRPDHHDRGSRHNDYRDNHSRGHHDTHRGSSHDRHSSSHRSSRDHHSGSSGFRSGGWGHSRVAHATKHL